MTISPRLIHGGIALIDPQSGVVGRVIALQYNPETLSRTLQAQAIGGDGADRSQALRLKGPPVETYKLEAAIDAADQMETGDTTVSQVGILPQLAALELLIYPTSAQLESAHSDAGHGMLQIAPAESPLTLFIWSRNRVVPVRITEFSITEEFFDPQLNPIRAKLSLGMRVLSVSDLGFDHRGGMFYMRYQRAKEDLAKRSTQAQNAALGIQEGDLR
jgi:hypothetical protein